MRNALYFLLVFLLPIYAHATVLISEIMYDLPGTDTGREWIEVLNTSASPIDLSTVKFFEGDTNHALTSFRGSPSLSPGGYAIIVEDPNLFLTDYPSYGEQIFDSSWSSFSNEGEVLEIRDSEGVTIDRVAYTKEMGASGDGLSLNRNGNALIPQNPSPGTLGSGSGSTGVGPPPAPSQQSPSGGSAPSSGSSGTPTIFFGIPKSTPEQVFSVSAGGNRTLTEQVEFLFEATVAGVPQQALNYVQYQWNFGNGEEVSEKAVRYRYLRRGDYVVVLTAVSGGKTVTDRIVVSVVGPVISIAGVTSEGIEIENSSSKDVDLSGWHVRVGEQNFSFPPHTWLIGKKSFFLESRVSKLAASSVDTVEILFPNGVRAVEYSVTKNAQASAPAEVQKLEEKVPLKIKATKPKKTSTAKKVVEKASEKVVVPPLEKSADKNVVVPSDLVVANIAAAMPDQASESPLVMSFVGLLALIGISSGAVIFMSRSKGMDSALPVVDFVEEKSSLTLERKKNSNHESALQKNKTKEADSYTIIE